MSIYDQASLVQIPSGYKAGSPGKLYSVLPTNGDGDFSSDSYTNATFVNSQGKIDFLPSDGAIRFDYPLIDGVVQSCPTLLLEKQSTNLFNYSEAINNSTTKTNVTITSNATTSPAGDGGFDSDNADSLNHGSTGTTRLQKSMGSITTGNIYTTSCFVKKNDCDYFYLWTVHQQYAPVSMQVVVADLQNGTIVSTGSLIDSSTITEYPNGWYRVTSTFTAGSISSYNAYYGFNSISNSTALSGGNSVSGYLWGLQLEESDYPTSYIRTDTFNTVTRGKDECYDAGTSSTFSNTTGTIFLDFEAFTPDDDFGRLLSLSDQSTNNRLLLIPKTNNTLRFFMVVNASTDVDTDQTISYNTRQKIAISYQLNSVKIYINGTLVLTDSSAGTFSALDRIAFADYDNNPTATARIHQLTYFDSVISQSDLETLTTL